MNLPPEDVVVEEPVEVRCGCPARSLGTRSGRLARSPVWSRDVMVVVEVGRVVQPLLVLEEVEVKVVVLTVVVGPGQSPGVVADVEWEPVDGPVEERRAAAEEPEKTGKTG